SCRCARSCISRSYRSTCSGPPEEAARGSPSIMPNPDLVAPKLIADIGGTNARFALLEGGLRRDEVVLACADYPDLVAATEHYLEGVGAIAGPHRPVEAAIAIAGPITGDIVRMTNHVWQFSAAQTRQRLGWRRFIVLNDFTALAMALR